MIHTNSTSDLKIQVGPKSIHFGPHYIPYERVSHMMVHEEIRLVRVFFTDAMCLNKKTTIDFVFNTAENTHMFVLRMQLFASKHVNIHSTFYPSFPHYTFFPKQALRHQYQFFPTYLIGSSIDLSTLLINPTVWQKEIQLLQDLAKINPRLRNAYNKLFGYFDLIIKHKVYKGIYIEFLSNLYHHAKSTPLNQWELVQAERLQRAALK